MDRGAWQHYNPQHRKRAGHDWATKQPQAVSQGTLRHGSPELKSQPHQVPVGRSRGDLGPSGSSPARAWVPVPAWGGGAEGDPVSSP